MVIIHNTCLNYWFSDSKRFDGSSKNFDFRNFKVSSNRVTISKVHVEIVG